jgi:hypothetical protein
MRTWLIKAGIVWMGAAALLALWPMVARRVEDGRIAQCTTALMDAYNGPPAATRAACAVQLPAHLEIRGSIDTNVSGSIDTVD